jgi:glycosyltransferase involved in cell wall biosynthesis
MKNVYLKGRFQGGPYHSLYRELVKHPPDGYRVLAEKLEPTRKHQLVYSFDKKLLDLPFVKDVWYEAKTLLYMGVQRGSRFECESELVFASQQLMFVQLLWVVDFEFANALVGYGDIRLYKKLVQKALASKCCKKILPWSYWAKGTLYRSLNYDTFKEKIEVVHLAVGPKDYVKKRDNDSLRLLFVGSTNPSNVYNFELKGGIEVVDAFLELSKKYDRLELAIRSWVPPEIKEKCSRQPNITIFHSPLSDEALADLYASSDVFVFPSHANLGMAILEAMSYQLPVVALGVYDVPEAVEDMKTGVLLTPPPRVPYYTWNGGPNHYDRSFWLGIRHSRPWLVRQIVEKVSLLIEDGSLRRRIRREARRLVEHGNFSIEERNEKLKRIFDEATKI